MDIKQYQALIQHAPYGFVYHRTLRDESKVAIDFLILEANAAYGKLTGLDPSKIIGKTVRETLSGPVEATSGWTSFYEQLDVDDKAKEAKRYSQALGCWYQLRSVTEDEDLFTLFFYEHTKPLETGQKPYKSEDLFRHLIQNSQVSVSVISDEYKVLYKESLGGRIGITGLSSSALNEMNLWDLIHPDDVEYARSKFQWMIEHPAQPSTFEIRIKNSSGGYTWLETISSNMLDSPDVGGFIMIVRDISKRKDIEAALQESENRLRYITDNVRDIVFLTDKELNAIYISPSAQDILGESVEHRLNKRLEEKFTPRSLELLHKLLEEELAKESDPSVDKNRSRIVELQQYKADGGILDISMHVSFVRDQNGQFNGLQGVSRDITQHKRTELELDEKHKYIESLLNAIPDLMFVFDHSGIIVDVKSGHEESLYMPKEQILNMHLADVLPKDLASKMLQKQAELLETGKTVQMQYQLMVNGALEDYEAIASPLGSSQIISLVRNITEQSRAVFALQQQNRFQEMITGISTAFVKAAVENIDRVLYESLERVGRYFDTHRAYIFRYSPDYSMLYNTNEWNAPERGPIEGMQKIYSSSNSPWWHQQIMAGKIVRIADKQELPAEAQAELHIMEKFDIGSLLFVPIETGSRVLGYFGFDSIGEKRSFSESEIGNLKVISNLLAEVLQKFDFERRMQDQAHLQELISGMALQYINLPTSKLHDSITASLAELGNFAGADRAFIFDYDWDNDICINSSEWCSTGIFPQKGNLQKLPLGEMREWARKHKAGEIVIVEDLSKLDMHDSVRKILVPQDIKSVLTLPIMRGEDCLGFVGFDFVREVHAYFDTELTLLKLFAQLLVNVRNRSELEKHLILEKERAEAANQAKSEFLANMSHEIRTPLNSVIGFSELLLNSSLSQSQRQYAQNIVRSSHSLLGIISDILDFSKIEAGKLELDPVRTDLINLVEHATDSIKVKIAPKDIELLLNIPVDMPRYAILDPLRLNQILINLLSNAEKFTEKGEIELKLSYSMKANDLAEIKFCVRDTGIGIGEAHKQRLFRAFTQLDSSTTRKYGGTGLGLVISNDLANLMDSKIELSSGINIGSEFFFTINCRVEAFHHQEEYAFARVKKALIIDDNAANRSILQDLLTHWKIESTAFASSIDAMQHLQEDLDYELIILDYQMPGLGGIPTIKMIRQQIPKPLADCPIILLLSTSEDEAVQTAVSKLKIRYTLEKPVKADELLGLLKIIDSNEEPGAGAEEAIFTSKIQTLHFEQIPRILIAEDNALNLALLKEMIFQQIPQAQIIAATDGLEAVYKVNELSPHLVLMDVQMPNLDGVNASIEIRKFSDLPIIAITAGALKEERERCQKAEMNGFLSKPVSVGELRDVLTSYLPFSQTAAPQEQNSLGTGNNKEHFNKAALLKNISGDTVILGSLLKTVLASFPDKIKCIKQALQQDDAEQIKAALHALRGTAQNMYFTLLGQRIGSLEQSFTGISAEERQESYQKIKAEWHIVRELINSELSN